MASQGEGSQNGSERGWWKPGQKGREQQSTFGRDTRDRAETINRLVEAIVAMTIKLVLLHLGQGIPLNIMTMAHNGVRVKTTEVQRASESLSSESNFEDEKAQSKFDDWMVSLPDLHWKLWLSFDGVSQKMNVTDAAQEPSSITGYNEKTVRQYHKEFFFYTEREV